MMYYFRKYKIGNIDKIVFDYLQILYHVLYIFNYVSDEIKHHCLLDQIKIYRFQNLQKHFVEIIQG